MDIFSILLIFVPIAIGAQLLHLPAVFIFFLSAIAIVPAAKLIGEATEKLSAHSSPALGGFLNAAFGNATELIISVFALRAGLVEVVKASLTGSIIGNLLLVLGMAMFAGGVRHKKQEFNRTAALASGSSLFLAVIALVIPAIFLRTAPLTGGNVVEQLSVFVSCLIIVLYVSGLWFSLWTHKNLFYAEEVGTIIEGGWSKRKSAFVLLLATVIVACMSEILVGSITPLVTQFGWTELFIGVIFIAIIGNVAEHASAVTMALRNKMDLALQVSIGSATQIAMFVAPLLVLVSLFFSKPMNLIFDTFELVAIVLSVVLVNIIVADGESNWLEGLQLLVAYIIIGIAFFFHP